MLLKIALIAACMVLYWVGGEKWAHTKFRDWGCSACIVVLAGLSLGWTWMLAPAFFMAWLGLSLGDDVAGDKWYWSMHGFVTACSMIFLAFWPGIILAILTAGLTYAVSKYLNKGGIDIWARGLIYACLPTALKFLVSLKH